MLQQIKGLHHVTSMAVNALQNNDFFTRTLGLRRVKKTVNFDEPSGYHLYSGDELGTPGTVRSFFPYSHIVQGRSGAGEISDIWLAVPEGSTRYWAQRLSKLGVQEIQPDIYFGETRLLFKGPDGDSFVLVEVDGDPRVPYAGSDIPESQGVQGLRGVSLRLRHAGATAELLKFMNYEEVGCCGKVTRFRVRGGNGADFIDLETLSQAPVSRFGAGSVHHVAFAVDDRSAQLEVRKALLDSGYQVTPVMDRDYSCSLYFRAPGGVLFEIATNDPGFARDKDTAHLGQSLRIPSQHAHLRSKIERILPVLAD